MYNDEQFNDEPIRLGIYFTGRSESFDSTM